MLKIFTPYDPGILLCNKLSRETPAHRHKNYDECLLPHCSMWQNIWNNTVVNSSEIIIKQRYVYTVKFYVAMKMNKLFKPFPISGEPSPETSDGHFHLLLISSHLSLVLYIFRKVCRKDFHTQNQRNFFLITTCPTYEFLGHRQLIKLFWVHGLIVNTRFSVICKRWKKVVKPAHISSWTRKRTISIKFSGIVIEKNKLALMITIWTPFDQCPHYQYIFNPSIMKI